MFHFVTEEKPDVWNENLTFSSQVLSGKDWEQLVVKNN
jgi:hypothetical protein